jgi:SAM-dependent methyltransferase
MAEPVKTLRATPEEEDFAHKYTEEGSGKVGGMLIDGYFRGVERLFKRTGLQGRPAVRAIEIGCGQGFSTQRLRKLLPDNVTLEASEYVAAMVPLAEKNNPGLKVTEESVYETKHANESFDLIFLLEVMEHLDYPEQALAELSRILKKDGYLIIGVPREPLWCMLNMARFKYLKSFGNTPGHLNHWSTFTLKRFVRENFGDIVAATTPLPWTQVVLRKK